MKKKQAAEKKTPASKPAKAEMRDTLTPRQVRVLAALNKAKGPITRGTILERISDHNLGNSLGHCDEAGRAKRDAEVGYRSLLTQKLAKMTADFELEGKKCDVFAITAAGKAALAKAGKAPGKAPSSPAKAPAKAK